MGTSKALTTKEDLTIGILGAIDQLPAQLLKKAELVSLSTTLITNACVEDRTGQAKLIFFGGDRRIIDRYGSEYGLPQSNEVLIEDSHTKFTGEIMREPDWDLFRSHIREQFQYLDGAGIIEMYAMKNGAVIEKKAKEIFEQEFNLPVICGHELFSELSCLQRGATTLLNASLFPTIRSFIEAIQKAMQRRGITAHVVIVRSDGSLMNEEFAAMRPVETMLCGPAASVLGGRALSNEPNCIMIDMGGTTTDIALIRDGSPVTVVDGIKIGKWKTFVAGLYVKTFGLGGDSAIHYKEKQLILEPYRIVPMCIAAKQYPSIIDQLKSLLRTDKKHTRFLYEHYMLMKDISENQRYSEKERAFCRALKNGPLILKDAAAAIGRDVYNLNMSRLVKEGIVQICGLTPTDIMQIKGDFTAYSKEASLLVAEFAARNLEITVEELCNSVYDEIKRELYLHIAEAILENKYPHFMKNGIGKETRWLLSESYEMAKKREKDKDKDLAMSFTTEYTLLGVGAPIHIFLPDVAKMLGTKAVIPEHSEVANALGAIVGNVSARNSVEIRPNYSAEGEASYTVYGNYENKCFAELEKAEAYAASEAKKGAISQAIQRGAQGNIAVTCKVEKNEAAAKDCIIYLGSKVTAYAVGTIGFTA